MKPPRHGSAGTPHEPVYSRAEVRADAVIHVTGVSGGIAAALVLALRVIPAVPLPAAVGLALYAPALLAMLGCSAAYNMTRAPGRKALLRRLDHAAIFFMIAGTYAPFALARIGGAWGVGLFAATWTLAVAGALHAVVWPRFGERAETAVYLVTGWSVLVAVGDLIAAVRAATLWLLLAGGVLYTLGVAFHTAHGLRFHNAIWHACVLAAAACHFAAIWLSFAPSPS